MQKQHIVGLDGIRAIAALCVLGNHVFISSFNWGTKIDVNSYIPWLCEPITTFFVLSGFVMAYTMLNELEQTGDVQFGRSCWRRAWRICPMYYLVLIVGVLLWVSHGQLIDSSAWWCVALLPNVPFALGSLDCAAIVHLWFVGVIVIFSLFFPWVVKLGKRHMWQIFILLCVVWFASKIGLYVFMGKGPLYRLVNTAKFDCILVGCVGAWIYREKQSVLASFFQKKWLAVLIWLIFFTTGVYAHFIPAPLRAEYIAVISLCLVFSCIFSPYNFENVVSKRLSTISYALYLVHPLVIYTLSVWSAKYNLLTHYTIGMVIGVFVVVLLLSILFADVLTRYVDGPLQKLRKQIEHH